MNALILRAALWCLLLAAPQVHAVQAGTADRADKAAPVLLWLTSDITTATRTAMVQRLATEAGLGFAHIDYPLAGPAVLDAADTRKLQRALAGAALGLPTPPETGSGADVLTRTASARSGPAGASLREALAVWRAQAAAIARHTAAVGEPGMARQVPYLGTVMAAGDVLLDRAFETWVHAEDLRTVLGRPALDPAPGDVHLMSDLGVRMLPGAWLSAGGDLDDELVHLVLTGPGGGAWRVGPRGAAALPDAGPAGWRPGLAAVVVMDGIDFCRLAGGRAEPHSVPHRVEGDRAAGAHVLAATALLARP